jgi:hypothetical protein
MSVQPLEYGRQPRRDPVVLIRRLAAAVVLLGFFAWAIRVACQRFYYVDRDSVRAALSPLSGGTAVRVDGFDDGPGWTVAGAEVNLDGSRARRISFQSPRCGELQSGTRMCVRGLGSYSVSVDVFDERVMVQFLDFGSDSEFRDVLPFHPRDVKELAARFDELVAYVEREPSGTYTAPSGKSCTYRIRASK